MPQRERLGFIGLGIMGAPMASNLLKAGYSLTVYNRSPQRAEPLRSKGALVAESPDAVGRNATLVFLCLGDTRAVCEISEALLQTLPAGSLVADCSTISPAESRRLAERFRQKGITFLDAPCSGSKTGAANATLTFMVGGERAGFERVHPFLGAMGKSIFHVGPQGMGLQVKLTQNLIGALTCHAMAEGFVLARKAGLSPSLVLRVLQASVAHSPLIDAKLPLVLSRTFDTHFSLKWMYKDLGLMLDSARELQVPLPATALIRELYAAAMVAGHAESDFAAEIAVLESLAGVEVVEDAPPPQNQSHS